MSEETIKKDDLVMIGMDCKRCEGTGEINWCNPDGGDECPECKGKGILYGMITKDDTIKLVQKLTKEVE